MALIPTRPSLLQRLWRAYSLRRLQHEARALRFSSAQLKRAIKADAQVLGRQLRMGYRDPVLATRYEFDLHQLDAMRQRRAAVRQEIRRLETGA